MNLPYLKIYGEEMLALIEPFSDAEKGRIFVGMMKYAFSGEEPQFSGNERFIWTALKRKIDIDAMAYVKMVEKNAANGKEGGRGKKKSSSNPENPVGLLENKTSLKVTQNPENPVGLPENKKRQEKEEEQEQEQEQEKEQEKVGTAPTHPVEQIQALFHETCPSLPQIQGCEGSRRTSVERCLGEYGFEKMEEVFRKANASDFLCGLTSYKKNSPPFYAHFDWILEKEHFIKILEGKYDNTQETNRENTVYYPVVDPNVNPYG